MIEKATYEARDIERNELMDRPGRKALFSEPARCDRAGRHEHVDAAGADAVDQRQNAGQFSDTRAMQPDKRIVRPCDMISPRRSDRRW